MNQIGPIPMKDIAPGKSTSSIIHKSRPGGVYERTRQSIETTLPWKYGKYSYSSDFRSDPSPQPALFNPVYTVEPVDKAETEAHSKERNVPSDVRVSKKGFRVTGIHSWRS
jgi:hypothetical protein